MLLRGRDAFNPVAADISPLKPAVGPSVPASRFGMHGDVGWHLALSRPQHSKVSSACHFLFRVFRGKVKWGRAVLPHRRIAYPV